MEQDIAGRVGHCFLRPQRGFLLFRGLPHGLRRRLQSFAASRLPSRGSPIRRYVAAALIRSSTDTSRLTSFAHRQTRRGCRPFNHLPQNAASNAVTDVTWVQSLSWRQDQIGKLTQLSNSCLQFLSFICYKQSTESRSVAAGRSLFESLASARHLRFKRVKPLNRPGHGT